MEICERNVERADVVILKVIRRMAFHVVPGGLLLEHVLSGFPLGCLDHVQLVLVLGSAAMLCRRGLCRSRFPTSCFESLHLSSGLCHGGIALL